jgi:hypothetical protein
MVSMTEEQRKRRREYDLRRYYANREAMLEYQKKSYWRDVRVSRLVMKLYREANRDKCNRRMREYYWKNRDKQLKRAKEYRECKKAEGLKVDADLEAKVEEYEAPAPQRVSPS